MQRLLNVFVYIYLDNSRQILSFVRPVNNYIVIRIGKICESKVNAILVWRNPLQNQTSVMQA